MLSVAVGAEAVRVPLALTRVRDLAHEVLRREGVQDAMVSIAFVTPRTIARLNKRHLGHRGPTDVIAFGFAPRRRVLNGRGRHARGDGVVGDVYIAPSVTRRNAERWGVGVREELARVVVHGILHVIGYDHPAGSARMDSPMWRQQERVLASLRTRKEKGERRKETRAKSRSAR